MSEEVTVIRSYTPAKDDEEHTDESEADSDEENHGRITSLEQRGNQ